MLAGLEWLAVKEGSAYQEGMALGWRGVEVEMKMGSCFQGPETTARFGSERGLGHYTAGGASPQDCREPLHPRHTPTLCAGPHKVQGPGAPGRRLPLQVPGCSRQLARVHGVPSRLPWALSEPGYGSATGSASFL